MRTLKGQMSEARSVKGAARPEFDDKLNRLKLLRDQRTSVQNRISDIRGHVKGLQVKTEAELDKLIQQEEERIRFGGVTLREEKQVLAELSKLRSQRDKIKQYEQQKGSLAGLEAELAKVKSSIDELDAEFNMVKTEREAVVSTPGWWCCGGVALGGVPRGARQVEQSSCGGEEYSILPIWPWQCQRDISAGDLGHCTCL